MPRTDAMCFFFEGRWPRSAGTRAAVVTEETRRSRWRCRAVPLFPVAVAAVLPASCGRRPRGSGRGGAFRGAGPGFEAGAAAVPGRSCSSAMRWALPLRGLPGPLGGGAVGRPPWLSAFGGRRGGTAAAAGNGGKVREERAGQGSAGQGSAGLWAGRAGTKPKRRRAEARNAGNGGRGAGSAFCRAPFAVRHVGRVFAVP